MSSFSTAELAIEGFFPIEVMAEKKRLERLAQQLKIELGALIESEIDDPRVDLLAVTHVRVSNDMRHARVYVSTLGAEGARRTALEGLDSARGFLRRQLSHRLGYLKRTPELTFHYDESVEKEMRIEELLGQIDSEER